MISDLEAQVKELRTQLKQLAERVRLDAVAEAFIDGNHEIREGDYFLLRGTFPTQLSNVSREGKWTYFDGHHSIEPGGVPDPGEHDRLYTIAEVAEIIARMTRTNDRDPQDPPPVPPPGMY